MKKETSPPPQQRYSVYSDEYSEDGTPQYRSSAKKRNARTTEDEEWSDMPSRKRPSRAATTSSERRVATKPFNQTSFYEKPKISPKMPDAAAASVKSKPENGIHAEDNEKKRVQSKFNKLQVNWTKKG